MIEVYKNTSEKGNSLRRLIIVGAGGHGKVVADVALAAGFAIEGFVDDNTTQAPLPGFNILGNIGYLLSSSFGLRNVGLVVAIGDNTTRKRISHLLRASHLPFEKIIHPSAVVSHFVRLGEGTVIMPGVVVNAGTVVGEHTILNTSCSVDHDCRIGDFAHISPGAHLAGNVTVEEGSHIGTGASIIPGQTIGEWSIIGAGAVVVRGVPPRVVVVGAPARKLRDL